jgi:hypothetical protein
MNRDVHQNYTLPNITNIDPKYWGEHGWVFLDSIALTYKLEHKDQYKSFFASLPNILPCEKCGAKMKEKLPTLDSALESKEKLMNWLLELRNDICKEKGKPMKSMKEVVNEIFTVKRSCFYLVLYVVLVIILVMLFFRMKKGEM